MNEAHSQEIVLQTIHEAKGNRHGIASRLGMTQPACKEMLEGNPAYLEALGEYKRWGTNGPHTHPLPQFDDFSGPGRKPKYTRKEILALVPQSRGIKAELARLLKMSYAATNRYCNDPEIAAAMKEAKEATLDIAEHVVFRNVELAMRDQELTNMPVDSTDAKWLLSKLGTDRGYGPRVEHTGEGGGPIAIAGLSTTQLAELVALAESRAGEEAELRSVVGEKITGADLGLAALGDDSAEGSEAA